MIISISDGYPLSLQQERFAEPQGHYRIRSNARCAIRVAGKVDSSGAKGGH